MYDARLYRASEEGYEAACQAFIEGEDMRDNIYYAFLAAVTATRKHYGDDPAYAIYLAAGSVRHASHLLGENDRGDNATVIAQETYLAAVAAYDHGRDAADIEDAFLDALD